MAKYFYSLAAMPKKKLVVKKSHAGRLKKYWGYFINQQGYNNLDGMKNASKAPLNHLFDIHYFCDSTWCMTKKMKQQGLKYIRKDGPFLNKEKDSKNYLQIKEICNCFSTDEQLQQSFHSSNTQKHECFNNMLLYIAPKNINYSHSNSLSFRFALCISLYNKGFLSTWNEIYN